MQFTDIFIKRPVLATVVSLMTLALGLRALGSLPIMQYPFTQNAVVTVATAYTGADPAAVAGFITTPLENSISQANGIDYMTSSSTPGSSVISVNLLLNYDPLKALSDITTKVNAVLNQLPQSSQLPIISVAVGETIDSMYIGFYSDVLPNNKITDYLIRVVQPKLQAINGVQTAEILGNRTFALRAWLDPMKMAGYGITSAEVGAALANNDFISAAGRTDGTMFVSNLATDTNLVTVEQFKNMVVKQQNGAIIRLRDVANVTLGAQNYNSAVSFDGLSAIYLGIKITPSANLLTVINDVRNMFPSIQEQLPEGLEAKIVYDASAYVSSSIKEVVKSLVEAFAIVTLVIFLFLGSIRSVVIPLIAIPLSIIGAFFCMLVLGYSINLLTLLALVLGIGLVVDDAIIVVENVQRHMEEGKSPFESAIMGARELASPIVAITVVLIAVYAPIGFMGGLTGALFTEFAFTLAGAVTVSAVIALTLSPMMCSKFLKLENNHGKNGLIKRLNDQFARLEDSYARTLHKALNFLPVVLVFAIIILFSNYFLFTSSTSELAPQEDQGIIISQVTAASNSALSQTKMYAKQVYDIFKSYPETDHIFQIDGAGGLNNSIIGMVFKPWDERSKTTNQLQPGIQAKLDDIAGAQVAAFQLPSLPGGGSGLPIQFVITSTEDFDKLNTVTKDIITKARQTGIFAYIDTDLKIDKAQMTISLDRDKVAQLGLNMQDIGNVLGSALSEGYINYFNYAGRSYQVIPQTIRAERINPDQVLNYYIKTATGSSVPLSTVATIKKSVVPQSLNHFQQLNSATISAVAFPGTTMGDALAKLKEIANELLPEGYSVDYGSQSRQYIREGSALIFTFFFALIVIFLSLAALFESFRDPLIVLISVPMSICGAMIFVSLGIGGATLNIYSEVGLVTLIGLISKHGILIVQFANDLQKAGKSKREAVEMAAHIRLRPILMTTAAMVLGVLPLIAASGAGAVSRYNIGLIIATGISIGTLFTLFVVPAMYLLIADDLSEKAPEQAVDSI
jgi:multidrug efflux pump